MKIERLLASLILGLGLTLAFLWLLTAGLMAPVYADTYTVSNTNAGGAGSLRQAILNANANAGHDTITFGPNVTGTITLTDALPAIDDDLTITGPGAEQLAISGANAYQVFHINSAAAVTITNVTVCDGNASSGGGIWSAGALHLNNARIVSNIANGEYPNGRGGGVYIRDGNATLNGAQVISNSAPYGGGVYIQKGSATLSGTQVVGNSAYYHGGGVYNGDSVTLSGTQVISNSARYGGGVFTGVSATLNETQVISNSARYGGGVYNGGSATLSGTQVVGNSAYYLGGGVCSDGSVTLSGTQVISNSAPYGSALFTLGTITSTSALTITGDIYQMSGRFAGSSHDLRIEGSLSLDWGDFYAPDAPHNFVLTGPFTHTGGVYHQTQVVNGSNDVGFPKAGGVILNANGQDLGSTEAALTAGDSCAGAPAGLIVAHCYVITPTITAGRNAVATFYYNDSEIPAGQSCETMEAFQWDSTWNPLTRDGSYGVGGRMCGGNPLSIRVTGVMTFSPFVLTREPPSAIYLPLVLKNK